MRIGIVHNGYRHRGGEDRVVEIETDLLSQHGHYVSVQNIDNRKVFATLGKTLRSIPSMASGWNTQIGTRISQWALSENLDLVHFHNIYPAVTPASLKYVHDAGIPVVMTLHNFRPLCAKGTMIRDGESCTRCVSGKCSSAIRHGCYRNSRLQSIAWSTGTRFSRKQDLWNQAVSMFIAPSEFVRDTFVDAGFDPDKVSVRPHTMPAEHTQTTRSPYGALIVGRLDHEKGAYQIASRWQQQFEKLTVIGVGEELEKIKSLGKTNIECVGWLEPKEVSKLMANARVLLQPSRLLETFGLTLVEAAAASRPSIAFNQGGPASIIRDGETGILVKTNSYDQFISKTQTLMNSPALCDAMGRAARTQYEQLNSTKAGHKSLMSIYQRVAYGRSTQCA